MRDLGTPPPMETSFAVSAVPLSLTAIKHFAANAERPLK
jgi:hypothetical protein